MIKDIFHTLTYRNNNDEVLEHGPYLCERHDAWLSPGYYFWEESIRAAHYWGTNRIKRDYIIFKANCTIDDSNCFDLCSNPKHIDELREIINELIDQGIATPNTTVGHVIDLLRKSGSFKYYSIRIDSTDAFTQYVEDPEDLRELQFDNKLTLVKLKLHLVVQIAIFDLNAMLFENFRLVYDSTDGAA